MGTHPRDLSRTELSEAFESACAIAAQQYADGCDTTAIDSQVDLLMAEMEIRSRQDQRNPQ